MPDVFVLGLCGPSGSGKSTIARALNWEITDSVILGQDRFFKWAEAFPTVGRWKNMELPEALNLDDYADALALLKAGCPARVPVYSKQVCQQTGWETLPPARLVIAEGFHLFWHPRLRDLCDRRISLVLPLDAQKARRLLRQPDLDPAYFDEVVAPYYAKYGDPMAAHAHEHIDASGTPETVTAAVREQLARYWREYPGARPAALAHAERRP